jgi:hypothetical protein
MKQIKTEKGEKIMRKQYIKIGNELFELKESVAFTRIYKTLNDCYTRPSNTKKKFMIFGLNGL